MSDSTPSPDVENIREIEETQLELGDIETGHFEHPEQGAVSVPQLKLLKSWMETAKRRRKVYIESARRHRLANKWLRLVHRILVGFLGGNAILEMFRIERSDSNFIYVIATAVFSVLLLLVESSEEVLSPMSKFQSLYETSLAYSDFVRDILTALTSGIDDRPEKVQEFILEMERRFEGIEKGALLI